MVSKGQSLLLSSSARLCTTRRHGCRSSAMQISSIATMWTISSVADKSNRLCRFSTLAARVLCVRVSALKAPRPLTLAHVAAKKSSLTAINPSAIARALGGIVIEYSLGQKRSYLWAITPTQVRLFELPGEAEIDSNVIQYQKAIRSSVDVLARREEAGIWLYEQTGSASPIHDSAKCTRGSYS